MTRAAVSFVRSEVAELQQRSQALRVSRVFAGGGYDLVLHGRLPNPLTEGVEPLETTAVGCNAGRQLFDLPGCR